MKRALRVIIPVVVLAAGVGVAAFLVATRPSAARTSPEEQAVPVEVAAAETSDRQVVVEAMGTVVPSRTVVIQPEVGGRIVRQNAKLVPGGKLRAKEVIARIDSRDYSLALDRERAAVSQAEFQVKLERGRKAVAEQEWQLMKEEERPVGPGAELALRDPHLANSEAALAAARSGLKRARLNVSRTTIKAPFNGMVREESVEVGQLVSPQSRLATLVATDEFWVQIAVPVSQLGRFDVPGVNAEEGAAARVEHEGSGGARIQRAGRVIRLLGDLDARGRMAQLLVAVEDPLLEREAAEQAGKLPLLLGSYVKVKIEGRDLGGVIQVPRRALRNGDRVWVMDGEDRLRIRPVEISWRDEDFVYVGGGLAAGERIVVSTIGTPIEGLALRVAEGGADK